MSTHATQEEAIAAALEAVRGGGTVHVFGPKQAGEYTAGELVCPDAGRVVYHPAAVALATGGHACASCGEGGKRPAADH